MNSPFDESSVRFYGTNRTVPFIPQKPLLVHPNFSFRNKSSRDRISLLVHLQHLEQFMNHVIMNSSNPTFGPLSFVRTGPKAGFRTAWRWTKSEVRSRDHLFQREIRVDKKWNGMHMRHVTISSKILNWIKNRTPVKYAHVKKISFESLLVNLKWPLLKSEMNSTRTFVF